MPLLILFAFIFLGSAFLSLWLKREPEIWGTFTCLSVLSGVVAGHIAWMGLFFLICLALLWIFYARKPILAIFMVIVFFGVGFKLRFFPGFNPFFITPKFAIGLENPLVGLFPLALVVPLAKDFKDWTAVIKGFILGCAGIALLALLATISGATHWDYTMPSYMGVRTLSNLILTSIPEEGFYRGFIQQTLCKYFKNTRMGNLLALILTSLLFTLCHIYWSPNFGILAFTFLASLLYGSVYLYSGMIESAILCHFLLNLIHMTFFSYHAS